MKTLFLLTKQKNSSQENLVEPIVIPIESIKVYNETPYILKKEQTIEIYALSGEYFLEFKNKKQANEFFNKSMRVASGYSKFVRGVKKVSKELKETNKALNITETTKKAIDFAADVTIDYAEKPKHGKLQILSSVAKVFKKRNKQNSQQIDAQPEKEKLPPHPTQEENNEN